jgi:arylsulfatase A-like enzyme
MGGPLCCLVSQKLARAFAAHFSVRGGGSECCFYIRPMQTIDYLTPIIRRILSALFFAGLLTDVLAAGAPKPNILYVLADDLGYADVGFNEAREIQTPNIDRIAKSGAILESFYVQPVCSPTRAALLTGRYAIRTGVYNVVRPNAPWGLPLGERTLPQALREAGYETAICGKWHLGESAEAYRPTRRGFDHQYGPWFGAIDYFTHLRDGQHDWHRDDQPSKDEGYSTHLLAREAVRIIREKQPDKPLFLYLPFNAVHAPHQVPESYLAPYEELRGQRRIYAGMLAAMDEAIGQVFAALEEKGLRENTLIVFSSDNGGPGPGRVTDNGPLRAGKGTIYEGGIRACAFAAWPGHIPTGSIIKEPLHAVDWYPTFLKLAGASAEQTLPLDGLDIWPVLTQGAKSPHESLLLCGTQPDQFALRVGDWKLLVRADEKASEEGEIPARRARRRAAAASTAVPLELYNLAADPGEKQNLADQNSEKVAELRTRLDAWTQGAAKHGGRE